LPSPPHKPVPALAAFEPVVARAAKQPVVARAAEDHVVALVAVDIVAALRLAPGPGADVQIDPHAARSPAVIGRIPALAAADQVVSARAAIERVVAVMAPELVAVRSARQDVGRA
jgi:hypothetical protein